MSIECRIVERHLGVEADQSLATRKLGRWNHGERIHLNEVGVALARNLHEASGNDTELLKKFPVQPNAEAESARLEGKEPTVWVRNFTNDRSWILCGDLFDFHATCGGGHDEDATRGAINEGSEIDLADDG